MAVTDAVCRLVPGVLSDEECFTGESHWEGLLEYPQYTRPEVWESRAVPEVLRGGNDALIRRWRRMRMLERTMEKRPDLWEKLSLSEEDAALLEELKKERSRRKLTGEVACRPVREEDVEPVDRIFRQARNYMRRHRLDQWQDAYPNADTVRGDIERGEGYVMTYDGAVAGDFCLTRARGINDLRVDTHRHNEAMKKLLARHGFQFRGNILVKEAEGHDPRRQAFEKVLK